MPNSTRAASIAVLVFAAVALAGCGVNGKPDYPEGTPMTTVTKPDGATAKKPVKSTRPFVLDGLLN